MSEPFIAEIRIFAGNFAPRNHAFCDGAVLPIAQNTALFALVGTTYGGDGRTTFALPDLRSRIPVHPGQGPGLTRRRLGERVGSETESLTLAQIPSHTHSALQGSANAANTSEPAGNVVGNTTGDFSRYRASPATTVNMAPTAVASVGGDSAHDNTQPFLVLNFIIALTGLFPSRN